MTDYAATPIQPIVQGLVTFDNPNVGAGVHFTGRGVSSISRITTVTGFGGFMLVLDEGLPGNAGAVEPNINISPPGVPLPPLPPNPDVRTMITIRGSGTPPVTTIAEIAVQYGQTTPPPVLPPGTGNNAVFVTTATGGGVLTDPAAFEIIIWVGPDSVNL
jgi:hypothetical protein